MLFAAIILFIILIVVLSAFYYNRTVWRLIRLFTDKKERKGKIVVWILSAFLSVMTFNLFSTAGIFMLHFFVFSLIVDLATLFFRKRNKVFKTVISCCLIPLLLASVIFGYGYINARNIVRTSYNIKSDEVLRDYKVLFVSDTHYGTILKPHSLAELKKRLDTENADIVILGGDLADESTTKSEMEEIVAALGSVSSKYGIYFVSGNHDFQSYSKNKDYTREELENALEENGICFLRDEKTEINNDIVLIGRDDKSPERMEISRLLADVDKDKFIITLDHQPVEYEEAEKSGTDLIVSGHTHAGQVFPAGYMIKLLKTADLWYGCEKFGEMDAVVSSGAAGWGFPIRTQKNSEYVVIEIRK